MRTSRRLCHPGSNVAVFWKCPLLPPSLLQSNAPLFPTQIARIARLSQIGCNIRTLAAIFGHPAHFNFCSKIRKIQRYVVFLRKVGLYSGAGLVFVENRAEGILGVQQQQGSNWLKVVHRLPDFGQVYLLVCSSKGECNIDNDDSCQVYPMEMALTEKGMYYKG